DVYRDDLIDALHYVIGAIEPSRGRTGAHAQHPLGIGHLLVNSLEHWPHLVGDGPHYHQQVRLTRRKAHHLRAKPRYVVVSRHHGHVLDSATGSPEWQRPERVLPCPIGDFTDFSSEEIVANRRIDSHSLLFLQ